MTALLQWKTKTFMPFKVYLHKNNTLYIEENSVSLRKDKEINSIYVWIFILQTGIRRLDKITKVEDKYAYTSESSK